MIFRKIQHEPSDQEIERDVAELRRLLEGIDARPSEPHPAYWQNFLVRVHDRVDGERFRRRRWSPTMALASLSAAVTVVVLALTGVIQTPLQLGRETDRAIVARNLQAPESTDQITGAQSPAAGMLYNDASADAIVLSDDDVRMLNAIISTDDDAVFQAMIEAESL